MIIVSKTFFTCNHFREKESFVFTFSKISHRSLVTKCILSMTFFTCTCFVTYYKIITSCLLTLPLFLYIFTGLDKQAKISVKLYFFFLSISFTYEYPQHMFWLRNKKFNFRYSLLTKVLHFLLCG